MESFVSLVCSFGTNRLLQRLKRWNGGEDLCNSINVFWKGQEGIMKTKVVIAREAAETWWVYLEDIKWKTSIVHIQLVFCGTLCAAWQSQRLSILKKQQQTKQASILSAMSVRLFKTLRHCFRKSFLPHTAAPFGCHRNHTNGRPVAVYAA